MNERAGWAKDDGRVPRYHAVTAEGDTLGMLLRDTSRTFHDLMDAVMLVNGHKYGDIAAAYPDRVDAIASLKGRLERYEKDGNVRWLVDVANFAMIEFTHPRHEKAHLGEDLSIGRVVPGVGETTERSNEAINAPPVAQRFASRAGD